MNITIRKVSINDAPAISALSMQLGYTMTIEDTARQVTEILNSPNDHACVGLDGDRVIGWIHTFYTVRLECFSYCEIGGLVVDTLYRGMGIGSMLIESVKPWCNEKQCNALRVRSNIKRNEAHKFYTKAGFTEIKQQKVFEIKL